MNSNIGFLLEGLLMFVYCAREYYMSLEEVSSMPGHLDRSHLASRTTQKSTNACTAYILRQDLTPHPPLHPTRRADH